MEGEGGEGDGEGEGGKGEELAARGLGGVKREPFIPIGRSNHFRINNRELELSAQLGGGVTEGKHGTLV